VARSFAIQLASVPLEMANHVAALHQTATSTERVSQIALDGASFIAFSR
jgi:hypothetical protein